jgi:transcriptional regulator with XRE-family HTH domain
MSTFLRQRRWQRALSAGQLAERLDVHPTSVLRWERRDRLPGPVHIRELARSLDVEPAAVVAFFDQVRSPAPETCNGVRGHGLRPLRRAAHVSARTIAETLGVHPAIVYNWEAGRARIPLAQVPGLARVLGLDSARLRTLLIAAPATVAPRPPASELRRMRRRTGLSQEQVAHRVGTTRQSIGAWERGQAAPLAALRRLAGVYGAPVATVARAAGVSAPPLLDPQNWAPGDLGPTLVVLRQWSGLTQADVASHCGCSTAAVRGWERRRGMPRPVMRGRLEQLYNLSAGALLTAYPAR